MAALTTLTTFSHLHSQIWPSKYYLWRANTLQRETGDRVVFRIASQTPQHLSAKLEYIHPLKDCCDQQLIETR